MEEDTLTPKEGELYIELEGHRLPFALGCSEIEQDGYIGPSGAIVRIPDEPSEITCKVHLRGITRGRFIKKLMACGIQRNEARQLAKKARELGVCYTKALFLILANEE